jgi:glutaminyl-peptide cyclotransferase
LACAQRNGHNATVRLSLVALLTAVSLVACNEAADTDSTPAAKRPDRFDSGRAWRILKHQVALGERPAGSRASRKLAAYIKRRLPNGSYQRVPGGLRNVVGKVPGRERNRVVLVGAHYDTKDIPGFVGANDAASGTAVALRLAREIKPRTIRPTLLFVFFDGEESPRGASDRDFAKKGLRGSKVAARRYAGRVDRMVLLDFVGDKDLSIPREEYSDATLWATLRAAAERAGASAVFPNEVSGGVLDDHIPFIERGVPAIDLIDFDFPCWHRRCDDLSAVSERSLDRVGETMRELLPML